MRKTTGYILILIGALASIFGAIGALFGVPILTLGALIVAKEHLGI